MTDADYSVTLYKLFVGDQQSPHGHFQPGYTIHAIIEAHFPMGTMIHDIQRYTQYNQTGFTEADVDEGDVILDSFGKYYVIKARTMWPNGDQFGYYELELEELAVFPHLSGFFGFEDMDHGTIGGMFEAGFERGEWAL